MLRRFPLLAFALLLFVACTTARPAAPEPVAEPAAVDPLTDPTIIGALEEAVLEGTAEAEAAARTGRRIGRVAGVFAAVFGGPERESLDETIDRYRRTRDAVTVTAAVIGAANGAVEGAQRGHLFDLQFAELHRIEGIDVFRPYPDEIEASLGSAPSAETLAAIATVFAGREERRIDIAAPGDAAAAIRDALIAHGVPASSLHVHRDDDVEGIVMLVRYA